MAELTRRATTLIKDMLTADGKLPVYNEEVVRQVLQQVTSHQDGMQQVISDMNQLQLQQQQQQRQQRQQQQQDAAGGDGDAGAAGGEDDADADEAAAVDWQQHPEHTGAIVVHHETILKLKRILLTYMKMRTDCLLKVRWQQRMLRPDVKENMSPQEQQFYRDYDRALNNYMGVDSGIGMDLTLDLTPPKDSNVRVMVLRDHGSIALSHSACVPLVKGSVHNLKCSEAEHLVRMGVLQVLDPNC